MAPTEIKPSTLSPSHSSPLVTTTSSPDTNLELTADPAQNDKPKGKVLKSKQKETKPSAEKKASVSKQKAKSRTKAQAPPTTSTSHRPSRNRQAPKRFWEVEEKKVPKAAPRASQKGRSKVFDPHFITTNSTSRLTKANVHVSDPTFTYAKPLCCVHRYSLLTASPSRSNRLEELEYCAAERASLHTSIHTSH